MRRWLKNPKSCKHHTTVHSNNEELLKSHAPVSKGRNPNPTQPHYDVVLVTRRRMVIADDKPDGKVWGLFKMPFRNSQSTTSSSSNFAHYQQNFGHGTNTTHSQVEGSVPHGGAGTSVSSVARSLLPTRRRLKLDPSSKLYFPCMDASISLSPSPSLCLLFLFI